MSYIGTGLNKKERKSFGIFMKMTPPDCLKASMQLAMAPGEATQLIATWKYIGEAVDAFFNDKTNPVDSYDLTPHEKKAIARRASYYFRMAIVIFEAEKFLKAEAFDSGLNYPFKKRSELLKTLAMENCYFDILCLTAPFHESPSAADQKAITDNARAFYNDGISEEKYRKTMRKLVEKTSHLNAYFDTLMIEARPWTDFCNKVIVKYRKQIPSFNSWAEWHTTPPTDYYKYAFKHGDIIRYPGRGASLKKKESS